MRWLARALSKVSGNASSRLWVVALCVVAAGAGCSAQHPMPSSGTPGAGTTGRVVDIAYGVAPGNAAWRVSAQELHGTLCMTLTGASGGTISTACGWSAAPSSGFWVFGVGPGHSLFIYGPVPSVAVKVQLSAPGYRSLVVPTTPIPDTAHLPRGRFYAVVLPGPAGPGGALWKVTALNAAGQRTPFKDF